MNRRIYVVDDARVVRMAIGHSLRKLGIETRPFASGSDFLEALPYLEPGCLLLDIHMPEISGIGVLEELARREIGWPAIVMTSDRAVQTAVDAMKRGAFEFLQKPVNQEALLSALDRGFALLEREIVRSRARRNAQIRIRSLSSRELDVLRGLQGGMPNRALAAHLKLSHRTIEMHRGNMMRKLCAEGLPDALKVAGDAGLQPLA
jgi:two-component system response regulator FixJ